MLLPDEVLLGVLCHLDRFDLDSVCMSSVQFHHVVAHRMSKICLRRLRFAVLSRGTGIRMCHEGGEEVQYPEASDVGRHLRSSYVEYAKLTLECIKGRPKHVERVVHEMMEHADTVAVDRLDFSSALFSPTDLTLSTRLVEALLSVNDVTFNGAFPERPFDASKFELYRSPPRLMDSEILEYCKKKSAIDSRRSATFTYASVRKDFVRKVAGARRRGELPDTLVLCVHSRSGNPEQDLSEVEQAEMEHHANIMGTTRQHLVSPDLVVCFGYDAERDYRDIAIWDQRSFAAKYEKSNE